MANIPRFTAQKLAGRCSELLLCGRNVFSSQVCYTRSRTRQYFENMYLLKKADNKFYVHNRSTCPLFKASLSHNNFTARLKWPNLWNGLSHSSLQANLLEFILFHGHGKRQRWDVKAAALDLAVFPQTRTRGGKA